MLRVQYYKTAPPPTTTSDANCKSRLSPVLLTNRLEVESSHKPLLGFKWLARIAHRTKEKSLLTRLPVCYKGYNSGTARWKRCIWQSTWERAWSFCSLSRSTTLPAPPCAHHPRIFSNSILWVFREASLHSHDGLNHWPLVIDSTSSDSPLPRGQVVVRKFQPTIHGWFPWQPAAILWLSRSFPQITLLT